MVANLCLITCAFLTAQSADRSEWLLMPRLSQGQELVYRGTYSEEAVGRGVQFSRSYRVEHRIFVLDTPSRNTEVALYTVFRARTPRPENEIEIEPSSVRLVLARLNLQGRISALEGVAIAVPLEGPATVECGALVEFPRGRIAVGQTWQVTEDNRPPRTWKVIGTEVVDNTPCIRLEGVQQSADWDRPRGDRTAWQRRDTIWLTQNLGVAFKVERTIERRAPQGPIQRSLVLYERQSDIQYPGRMFEERRREILQVRDSSAALAPLLTNPARYPARTYDALLSKINYHIDHEPRTPFREAVIQVKRHVEAAKRGETPPAAIEESTESTARVGQRAPDFVTTNLLTRESVRLRRWLGRPVVMVFYTPNSAKAEEVLRFAQSVQNQRDNVHVIGFVISDDIARIRQQCKDFSLSLPILSGKGLRQSYNVDATPKLLVVDADGIVRGSYDGWGAETPTAVTEELKLCLQRKPGVKSDSKPVRASPDR